MKMKLIYSLIGSVIVNAYVLFADYLYAHGHIALDSLIYRIDLFLLYPSYFFMAVISGWNRGRLGDVPGYVFIIASFLIYFAFFYFIQMLIGRIRAEKSSSN